MQSQEKEQPEKVWTKEEKKKLFEEMKKKQDQIDQQKIIRK
jgi:hypothetical protein